MALSKILENSISDGAVAAAKLKDFSAAVDLNGVELILDADQDTSITADTDDRIDFKIANVEHFSFSNSSGDTVVKPMVDAKDIIFQQYDGNKLFEINDGNFVSVGGNSAAGGEIRIYEDTDLGTNYTGFKAGNLTSSVAYQLPLTDAASSGQALTSNSSGVLSWSTISTAYDDLTTGDAAVNIATSAGNITIDAQGNDTDIIFKGTDGGADRTFMTIDGSAGGDLFLTGGLIDLKNDGSAVSNIKFYCESSNAHAQTLIGAPHSEGADNVLTLPGTGGDARLVSTASTATLTNKTLTSPKINEDVAVTATATELNLLDGVSGLVQADLTKLAAIDATAAEINLIDGGATVGTTAIADGDGLLINDAGTMRVSTVQTLAAYLDDEITAMPNLVTTAATTVGALDSGSITSGFTSIDVGAGAITTTGTGTIGNLVVDDVAVNGKVITMTGSTDDTFTTTVAANGATSLVTVDTAAAAAHLQITADGTVDIDSAGVLTLDSGAAINIEPAAGSAILLDGTISVDAGVVTGATSITSTAFVGDITGDVTGTADVATVATTVTITDNESTNESNALIFTAGGDVDGGNIGLESDGTLTYNPSTGKVTATGFVGTLTGNVTGNASGTALTVTQAAQTAITSVGTLTAFRSTGIDDNADALAMTIDSNERIGIGTTSPQNPLEVSGNTNYLVRITQTGTNKHMFKTVGNGASMDFLADGANNYVGFNSTTSGDDIRFETNDGNERVRILAAGGMTFNGDTAAANALNDYEEGTFTVTLAAAGGGTFTLNGDQNLLVYTKIGNLVSIGGRIKVDSISSPSGEVSINGLPFSAAHGSGEGTNHQNISVHFRAASSDVGGVTGQTSTNAINIYEAGTTGNTDVADKIDGGTYIMVGGVYRTSA